MPDYKKLYLLLFNAITDALRKLDACEPESARTQLIRAQQTAEEAYIESGE